MIPLELHAALWQALAAAGVLTALGYAWGAARRRRALDREWFAGRAKGRAEGITRGRAGLLQYCEDRLIEGLQLQLGPDGPYWAAPGPSGRWAAVPGRGGLEHARSGLLSQEGYRAGLAAIVADTASTNLARDPDDPYDPADDPPYTVSTAVTLADSSGPLDLLDAEISAYMADRADTALWRLRADTDHRLFCFANDLPYAPIDWEG